MTGESCLRPRCLDVMQISSLRHKVNVTSLAPFGSFEALSLGGLSMNASQVLVRLSMIITVEMIESPTRGNLIFILKVIRITMVGLRVYGTRPQTSVPYSW